MFATTAPSIDGHRIVETKGILTANVVYGTNALKDFAAGIRNFVGGRVGSYENTYSDGDAEVLAELDRKARNIGANALINVHISHGAIGQKEGILTILATGTAVVAKAL